MRFSIGFLPLYFLLYVISQAILPMGVLYAAAQPVASESVEETATTSSAENSEEVDATATSAATASSEAAKSEKVNVTQSKSEQSKEEPAREGFVLPREQHPWAKFQPGAWRELQVTTETYNEAGEVVSRSVTIQKEILEAIADGKYVLKAQATVELRGKRMIGDWKTRALHLAIDGVGPLVSSRQLGDQTLLVAGRSAECQVWDLRYQEGGRNLRDRIYYDPQLLPFMLRRETFADTGKASTETTKTGTAKVDAKQAKAAKPERVVEVMATAVPYRVGGDFLRCHFQRIFKHRAKGDTVQLAFTSSTVPGGEVAVWSTDTDVQGKPIRSAVVQVLSFGEASPGPSEDPSTTTEAPAPAADSKGQ